MAVKKVTLKEFNGTDYDELRPETEWDQIQDKPTTFTPTAHSLNSHTDVDANPTAAGQVLTWDADNSQWIASTTAGGGVSKSDLQNVYIYGKASGAITIGQAVQFAGVEGDHILIKAAVPSEINAEPTLMIGIAETTLADNEFGYVIVNGRLNLDTSTYTAGDLLYFASAGSTDGALTTTEPTDPNASIQMAAVSIDGVGNGEFIIRNTILTRQINEVIGLQGSLDGKVSKSGDTMTGDLTIDKTAPKIFMSDDTLTLGLASEVGGELIDYGTNYNQLGSRNAAYPGSFFRIDVRDSQASEMFNVKYIPPNSTEQTVFKVSRTGDVVASGGLTTVGNVGIGTTSPSLKLSVVKGTNDGAPNLGTASGSFSITKADNGNDGLYGLIFGVDGTGNSWQQVQRIDGTATAYNLLLQPSGGNVGIGTTSPGAKLEVYQSGNGASNSLIVKDDARQILIGRDEIKGQDLNGNSSTLYVNHTGGNIILNGTSGNVGIGTTSPGQKLSVSGNIEVSGTVDGVDIAALSTTVSNKANIASPALTGTPTAPTATAGTNTTQIATTAFVSTAVSNLVSSAPGTLDTLNELAAALGDDPNFATTVSNNIGTKVSKSGDTMTGTLTTRQINMQNYDLTGVNNVIINDPGPNEGIQWNGGNLWKIYESPDNQTNAGGNLQFVQNTTRRFTLNTNGEAYLGSNRVFHDGYHPNADKWTTARTLSLTGDVTGSVSWDGSGNASLTTTVVNDSHTHDSRYARLSGGNTISGNQNLYGTDTSGVYSSAPIELREVNLVTTSQSSSAYAPAIAWHWGGRAQVSMRLLSNGKLTLDGNQTGQILTTTEGKAVDSNLLDGVDSSQFLRSDTQDAYTPKRLDIGVSSGWDAVGFGNATNVHFNGHNQFWIGAGNGTWFKGSANQKSQSSGLAADASWTHDLLITTMPGTSVGDRGITFAVDSNAAGTAGWRLGKWHSGTSETNSMLAVNGQIHAKGGHTDSTDYYADDYSTYHSTGQGGWVGDGGYGWHKPSIVAAKAIQIQSGTGSTNSAKPQLQFHQYGYGGPVFEYDGPNNKLQFYGPTSRLDGVRFNTHGQSNGLIVNYDQVYSPSRTMYINASATTDVVINSASGGNTTFRGNIYGKDGAGYSNIYRIGGLYLSWDNNTYGVQTNHSLRSTYGDTYGDHITLNSYGHIRMNIDSNNNGSNNFEIGAHTTGTGNTYFQITDTGQTNVYTPLNVYGNILLTGGATTTNQGRMIDFTGFDKEGTTDFSDRAYIQHTTNTGGHSGSVLVISSQNDSNDGIAFLTNASSKLKWNSQNLATEAYVTSRGYTTYSANQALNTSSNPTFNEIYANGWFRNNQANEGLYNQSTGLHWYSTDAFRMRLFAGNSTTVIQEFATTGGTVRGSIFANDSNQIGFLNNSGNTIWRMSSSGSLEVGTVPWARLSGVPTMIHTDTSSQASVNNSGTTVIQDISLDTYGHTTSISSVTLTGYGDPVYSVSGGTISTAYDRWYRVRVSSTVYMYIFTGYVTVSSSTGTATITLPISITDGNVQATSGVSSSSGSGGDLVYGRMATSSSTATFYITKDYATTTQGRQVYFKVTGYSSTVL